MRRHKTPVTKGPVEIEVGGERICGEYELKGGCVIVSAAFYGSQATQLGESTPEHLARTLLHELVAKGRRFP